MWTSKYCKTSQVAMKQIRLAMTAELTDILSVQAKSHLISTLRWAKTSLCNLITKTGQDLARLTKCNDSEVLLRIEDRSEHSTCLESMLALCDWLGPCCAASAWATLCAGTPNKMEQVS